MAESNQPRFLLGSVLLGLSALLMIPSALGLAEYSENKPASNMERYHDTKQKKTTKNMKVYALIQLIVLVLAILGFVSGGAIMIVATKRGVNVNTLVTPALKPGKIGGVSSTKKSRVINAGGVGARGSIRGRSLAEFELF